MDILTIVLIVVLILALAGGLFPVAARWPVGYGGGHPINVALLVLIVVIILFVFIR